ncbi:hypothetical protein E4U59_007812 [Claviceps monticola]|nr:hypothetical protein E4U59_007812 [Claviceps monticola]
MSSPKYEIEIEIEQAAETTKTRLEEFRDILNHRAWQREMAAAAGVSYWHLQPLRLEECAHLFPLIYTDEQYSQLLDDFPMEAFEVYGLWGIYAFPSPCESAEGGQQAMHASRKAGEEESSEQESLSLKMEPSATPTGEKQIKNKKTQRKVRIEKEGEWVNLEVAFKVLTRASGDERWMSKPCPRRVTRKRGRRRCKSSQEYRKRPESTRGPGARGHCVSRSRNVAGS